MSIKTEIRCVNSHTGNTTSEDWTVFNIINPMQQWIMLSM